jgi:hypothetical protein
MLQSRGQGPVLYLDTEEFQMFLMIRAGNAIGAHDRLLIDPQAQHDEVPVLESQSLVTRRGEAEDRLIPMMDGQYALCSDCSHAAYYRGIARNRLVGAGYMPMPKRY